MSKKDKAVKTQEEVEVMQAAGIPAQETEGVGVVLAREIIGKNPAISVKPLRTDDRPKASETIHRALTREEQKAFMQEAQSEWLYEFFCFSLCTGMRINEITALRWSDIDYVTNVIHVTKTI